MLTAWLDSLGNVLSASASLDVHPNTFRYRLRRAAEIAGMDLNDPEKRFAAMLELRIMRATLHKFTSRAERAGLLDQLIGRLVERVRPHRSRRRRPRTGQETFGAARTP
ncbi:helix-turn-helix domain-containing protein [Streptomyces sp. NPDC058066]|uniref:helix-turn-helix domain-containing protein n=1 Tax=Streptomyces sp. NPDC058066 TaxID=3346323 RepID=UPI0036E17A41